MRSTRRLKKTIMAAVVLLFFSALVFAVNSGDVEKEKKAIKKVIEEAYIKGIFINRDVEAIKKGFSSEFNMLMLHGEHMHKLPISKWIENTKKSKEKNPGPIKAKITHKVPLIDVTGNAAVAKIEVSKDGKHIYSDYMSFYKFGDNWKIVNKIYFEHK